MDQNIFLIVVEFGATFLGTIIAFGLVVWYDRRVKHREEIKIKIKTLESIYLELGLNLDLHRKLSKGDRIVPVLPYVNNALNSAVGAGNFSLLDPNTQKAISQIYNIFSQAETIFTKVFSMSGFDGINSNLLDNIKTNLDLLQTSMETLETKVPKLRNFLEEKIGEYRKELNC